MWKSQPSYYQEWMIVWALKSIFVRVALYLNFYGFIANIVLSSYRVETETGTSTTDFIREYDKPKYADRLWSDLYSNSNEG